MSNVLNFGSVSTSEQLRAELQTVAQDQRFGWMKPITECTCDEYVRRGLINDVQKHRYAAWTVEENLAEISKILNNALDLRAEVLGLEAQAVQAALDLQLAEQIQVPETRISKIGIAAARKQSQTSAGSQPDPVDERSSLLSAAREAQIALHNTTGHALNYGERVSFLRSLYSDNINIAQERAWAIWIGATAYFGITVEAPSTWTGAFDSLFKFVIWVRKVNRLLDEGRRFERTQDVFFALGRHGFVGKDPSEITQQLRTAGKSVFRFKMVRDNIPGIKQDDVARVIGCGITMTYGELHERFNAVFPTNADERSKLSFGLEYLSGARRSMGLSFDLQFPTQTVASDKLETVEKSWALERTNFSGVSPWFSGSPQDSIRITRDSQFINIDPFGEWEVSVGDNAMFPSLSLPREAAGAGFAAPGDFDEFKKPVDVILALRIATRKRL